MDPPLPPPPVSSTTTTTPTNTNITHLGYPDSVDSSPRSRNTDSWDEPLPPIPGGAKLRLMCSYGGHIVPRPHDKSLCYLGGDTRIIVVDRHSSLSDLSLRLSRSLLSGRSFTLKYQLPNEDLDSLISVTTDEDLDNMIEEYDRTSSASLKPSRLRLFLFLSKPESASSMGSLLDDSKSESWFVDALNGAGNLPRGLSADAASVNCLLGLDEVVHVNRSSSVTATDVEAQNDSLGNINKQVKHGQDVQSVPDSPMMETSSSFGSTSSSPSMSNLPPIRVHVEDQKSGFEEQFSQMNISAAASAAQKQQDEGFVGLSSPPPPLPTTIISGITSNSSSAAVVTENPNRVFSDDERSDYGVPTGFRKPPQPPPPQQLQQKTSGGVDLQSPDGGGRDISRSKPMYYQEMVQQVGSRVSANPVDPKRDVSDPSYRIPIQQVQDSGYVLSSQLDQQQQQFIHGGTHYIQHHPSGQVPMSYYPVPVYLQQQQQQQQQQQHQQQLDQQYHHSMYFLPVHQTQPYNVAIQSNLNETTKITSSRPPTPPTPTMISNAVSYKESGNSPVYPPRSAPPPKPDLTQSVYRTATTGAPHVIHTPSDQHPQQYMSYHQMHHQSQSTAAAPANYGFEYTDPSQAQMYSDPSHGQVYSDPSHTQIYYTQPLGSILPTQYQTMNAAAAVAAVSEASAQMPTDNMKQQQIRTSQPL